MDEPKALSLLGLAMRAGQVIHGDGPCERQVRKGKPALVLLDRGVSGNTREKYVSMCVTRGIPLYEISADALGTAIGRPNRMVAVVAKGSLAEKLAAQLR